MQASPASTDTVIEAETGINNEGRPKAQTSILTTGINTMIKRTGVSAGYVVQIIIAELKLAYIQ